MKLIINKIKFLIKRIVFAIIKPPPRGTYAQAGEDVIMKFLFDGKGIATPSYLELGTNKPDEFNNTYLFYSLGSRGVCVEADSTLIEKIIKVRPDDKVINVGVGLDDKLEEDFYIFNEPSLSTFNLEEALYRQSLGSFKIVKVVKVKLQSLNSLIQDNFSHIPDILSIDIEGLDFAVLQTLDFDKYPISVVCVETCAYSETHIKGKNSNIIDLLISKGYFVYADTYINTIFVNKVWFNRS
jgi:hypothetical protein